MSRDTSRTTDLPWSKHFTAATIRALPHTTIDKSNNSQVKHSPWQHLRHPMIDAIPQIVQGAPAYTPGT
eukprot:scaffold266016_cov70-Attheya_sp.AAC.1